MELLISDMLIVVAEPLYLDSSVRTKLESVGELKFGPYSDSDLKEAIKDANVLMVRLAHKINDTLLESATNLKYVITATTGLDHIDLDSARRRNITVISLRDCMDLVQDVSATAEHTWALLLSLTRNIPASFEHVLRGGWNRDLYFGNQLKDKKIGIIGLGRIGSKVAKYARAFGMKILAYDLVLERIDAEYRVSSLDEILEQSDIVTLHITATDENRNFMNKEKIDSMKAGSFFINTSRGWLADNQALADAVKKGYLAGVAVDVLMDEDIVEVSKNPLLVASRQGFPILITPHIGGATMESLAQAEDSVVSVFLKIIEYSRK